MSPPLISLLRFSPSRARSDFGDDDPSFRSFSAAAPLRAAAAALTSTGDANVTGGQTSETPLDLCLTRKVRRKRTRAGGGENLEI